MARSRALVVAIYLVVGAATLWLHLRETRQVVRKFILTYAAEYAQQQRAAVLGRVDRELVLAQKMADSPLLLEWIRAEDDPGRRKRALDELESYRRLFSDHSWFVAFEPRRHYYYNDEKNQFRGHELRHTLNSDDLSNHWYFNGMANIDQYGLHVDHSEKLDVTKLWLNVVVRDGEKKVGMAGSGLDVTSFLKSVVKSPRPGVTTILVDRHGAIQGHPDEALMGASANRYDENNRTTIFNLISAADRPTMQKLLAAEGDDTQSFEVQIDGRTLLGASVPLPSLDWDMLVLVDPRQMGQRVSWLPLLGVWSAGLILLLLSGVRAKGGG